MSKRNRAERIKDAAVEIVVKAKPSIIIDHKFELLTPIFGGAARSRKAITSDNDRDNPLRVSGIRGQLRFWWRAARAGQFNSLEKLSEREAQLWGKGTSPGVVNLRLDSKGTGFSEEQYFEKDSKGRWRPKKPLADLAYLGFPLKPSDEDAKAGISAQPAIKIRGTHTLIATLSPENNDDRDDVEAAIWAWAHLGGIGGRTRRGFGAISTTDDVNLESLLQDPHIIDTPPVDGVPSLAPSAGATLLASGTAQNADDAWKDLAKRYHSFRQGEGVGRNPPQRGKWAGRSRWAEPDVIRHDLWPGFTGAPEHEARITAIRKAPRAQFGMPIIFHFIEKISDHTLKPHDHERLASPLILRPVGNGKQVRGVALVLGNRPDLNHLGAGIVFEAPKGKKSVEVQLTSAEAATLRAPLNADPDPLRSFLAFLTSKGYR